MRQPHIPVGLCTCFSDKSASFGIQHEIICLRCREAPGLDQYRPDQKTPVVNFYMAGSYTAQDYIDSMEGATLSGRQCAYKIINDANNIVSNKPSTSAAEVAAS